MEEGRDLLYQGLLQAAVALYHHRNGNRRGARKLFRGALEKLKFQPADALGIDLAAFRRDAQACLDVLNVAEEAPFTEGELEIHVLDPLLQKRVQSIGEGRSDGSKEKIGKKGE